MEMDLLSQTDGQAQGQGCNEMADDQFALPDTEPTEVMPMISTTDDCSIPPKDQCGLQTAEEQHPCMKPYSPRSRQRVIVLWCYMKYFLSFRGIVQLLQVVFSASALVCLTTSAPQEGGYLALPLSWHLRVFVFTTVTGFLTSLIFMLCHVTLLVHMYPISWSFINVVAYSFLSFMFLFGTSLVASAIDYNQKLDGHIREKTIHQLIATVVLGYINLLLYSILAFYNYREWKGGGVQRPERWAAVKVSSRAAKV